MLISLRSDHKEHLQLLTIQSIQVVMDFCKLAIDFLQNGPNEKRYTIAADKLEVDVDAIRNCVHGLLHLFLLSNKHKLTEADFRDSVLTLGFSQEQQVVLSKFYESTANNIEEFTRACINEPHYHDLKWRCEAHVASRSLLEQATPLIAMELSLKVEKEDKSGIDKQTILLQTDPNNLLHLANELEKALNESRSRHSRKIQKTLNS